MAAMDLTPAEAKAIATSAYIFLTPLVLNYVDMYDEAIAPSSRRHRGFGRWLHRRTSPPPESDLAATSSTWLHSSAWLDLRPEPWVVAAPTMEAGRACTLQTTDLWGFVVDEATDGHGADRVLVAAPGWMGGVGSGIDRVARGESSFVRTEIWTFEPRELSDLHHLQRGAELTPLSGLRGVAAPVAGPPVEWWPVDWDVTSDNRFWWAGNFALRLTTPNEQDRSMYERIGKIGIGDGRQWEASQFDDPVLEAIGEGMDDAITELMRASATVADARLLTRSRADTDRDYFGRALGALQRRSVAHAEFG